MKQTLLGFRRTSFKGRDGEQVEGTRLYTRFKSNQVDAGEETGQIFVRPELVPGNIRDYIGKEIAVEFNQRGSVMQLEFPMLGAATK